MGHPAIRLVLMPLGRHNARGLSQGRKVWVDPRRPHPVHTLLHEMIHVEQPSLSESAVIKETARQWRKMTWQAKAELLTMFGTAHVGETND